MEYVRSIFSLFVSYLLYGLIFCNVAIAVEATVKSDYMEVYTGAGRGYPVFFVVERNEKFKLLKRKTDWIEIESTQGQIGWVSFNDYASAVHRAGYSPKKKAIKSKWELGFSVGAFGSDKTLSGEVGYYINPIVAIQAEVKKVVGVFSYSNIVSGKVMVQGLRNWFANPFFHLGMGRMSNIPRESLVNAANAYGNSFLVGGGVNYIPYKRTNIRFSVNNYYLDKLERNYIDIRLGVYALFG